MLSYLRTHLDPNNKTSFVRRLRSKRFDNFLKTITPAPHEQILDVGGSPSTWEDTGLEQQVTILNLNEQILDVGGSPSTWEDTGLEQQVTILNLNEQLLDPPFQYIKGDAR